IQPRRNLFLFLWGNWQANPLCHGMPPHSLILYGTTQPATSASLVPQGSQQFNVKKKGPQFAPPFPKRNQSFPSRP
ncbi:hypothetical protein AVEN_266095-1, partial [Araneus ventricosus]